MLRRMVIFTQERSCHGVIRGRSFSWLIRFRCYLRGFLFVATLIRYVAFSLARTPKPCQILFVGKQPFVYILVMLEPSGAMILN